MKLKIFRTITFSLSIFCLFYGLAQYINLSTADLGRHISNGKFIVNALINGLELDLHTPLYQNFYSYTEPSFEVINHHWLTGVIHYLINQNYGFEALSLFHIVFIALAAMFFFLSARRLANIDFALISLVFMILVLVSRTEVRPESISYALMGLQFYVLTLYRLQKLSLKYLLIILFLLQVFWVNAHIFFCIGLVVAGAFYLESVIQSRSIFQGSTRNYLVILFTMMVASLINPFGLEGLLVPLNIFRNYPYMLVENQSIFFMQARSPQIIFYYYVELIALVNIGLWFLTFKKAKQSIRVFVKANFANLFISIIFMILAFKTNRAIPIFVLYIIPVLSQNLFYLTKQKLSKPVLAYSLLIIYLLSFLYIFDFPKRKIQLGLAAGQLKSIEFFRAANIQGPILNNYDIGGYLIYNLFPQHRVFVDNRPEAYSEKFFNEIYKPMQESETIWQEIDKQFNFNVIFFQRHDNTEHAQPFLIRRIRDPFWAPVFVDENTIILLKRNALNKPVIDSYELPQGLFKAVKS